VSLTRSPALTLLPAGQRAGASLRWYSRLGPVAVLPLTDLLALLAGAAIAGQHGWRAALYVNAVLIAAALSRLHRVRICLRVFDQAGRIIAAAALPALLLLPWTPAAGTLRVVAWSAGLLLVFRLLASAALRAAHRRGWLMEPTLVVGAGELGQHVTRLLGEHPQLGLKPRGFLDSRGAAGGQSLPVPGPLALPVLGQLADLPEVVARHRIRRVIVCFPCDRDTELVPVLRACRPLGADICVVPRLHELGAAVPRACMDEVWGIPLIPLRPGRMAMGALGKRAFDIVTAAVLLILAAPVVAVLAVAGRRQLRRPALFRQVRVVGAGRLAEIVKLRTLGAHRDLDTCWDPDTCWSAPVQRCTSLGRFLRATHLDELPQLVNVLRGEMSLVGPRPERPYFARQFGQEVPGYHDRNRVPAGLTGWAQVHGLNGDTSIGDRVRLDNSYIENWSFWLDLTILARTLGTVVATAMGSLAGSSRNAPAGPLTAGSPFPEPIPHSSGFPAPEPAFSKSFETGSNSSLGGSR
jgi:exopolysaccharide biosynthesis polyprenyl glycosylphosphotransferase